MRLTFILFLFSFQILHSQESGEIYFKISSEFKNPDIKTVQNILFENQGALQELFEKFHLKIANGIALDNMAWHYLSKNSTFLSGSDRSVQSLKNIFKIRLTPKISDSEISNIISHFQANKKIDYITFHNKIPIPPPYDIPPATPSFIANQTYLQSDPGVNFTFLHNQGMVGNGIRIRDVEYGFRKEHEEFNEVNAVFAPGMTMHQTLLDDPDYAEYVCHGTATIGELFAHAGEYGITGMVHGAEELVLFLEWTNESGYSRVNAVTEAINASQTGDIIMFEMQSYGATGSGTDFVPAEFDPVIWDLTKAATDAGIVIVAAAGNGNQDLDSSAYSDYMNRGNSGAILVGAGTSDTNHNRKSFSTYGSRIDLQGWGENVFTTGYTDVPYLDNDINQRYTSYFSGTSSATPIVAACVVALQSIWFAETEDYLTGNELKNILQNTGISQGMNISGNIGPLPNMEEAYFYLRNLLGLHELSESHFTIYPNPTDDLLHIEKNIPAPFEIFIYNTVGQKLMNFSETNELSLKSLVNGVYYLKISFENKFIIHKIIKK